MSDNMTPWQFQRALGGRKAVFLSRQSKPAEGCGLLSQIIEFPLLTGDKAMRQISDGVLEAAMSLIDEAAKGRKDSFVVESLCRDIEYLKAELARVRERKYYCRSESDGQAVEIGFQTLAELQDYLEDSDERRPSPTEKPTIVMVPEGASLAQAQAILEATEHPRSNEEKRRMVEAMLAERPGASNRDIAKRCNVTESLVASCRKLEGPDRAPGDQRGTTQGE